MVVRTQIALDAEAHRRAKQRASELNVSLAEYIRRLVARDLGERRPAASPDAIFDLGTSTESDVGRHKDKYLAEAVEGSDG
jgi:hypothetical protein